MRYGTDPCRDRIAGPSLADDVERARHGIALGGQLHAGPVESDAQQDLAESRAECEDWKAENAVLAMMLLQARDERDQWESLAMEIDEQYQLARKAALVSQALAMIGLEMARTAEDRMVIERQEP